MLSQRYVVGQPPPESPPAGIRPYFGERVWRVVAEWWRAHQPDSEQVWCKGCQQRWPCPAFSSARRILNAMHVRAALGKGEAHLAVPDDPSHSVWTLPSQES